MRHKIRSETHSTIKFVLEGTVKMKIYDQWFKRHPRKVRQNNGAGPIKCFIKEHPALRWSGYE